MRISVWVLLGAVISTGAYYLSNTMPRQKGVESVKEAVRNDFLAQKGIKLTSVGFLRKNENELHGFAAFPLGLREVVRGCIALRQNSDAPYSWACY
jgi:hypothetical protein